MLVILRYFAAEFGGFGANYVTLVEVIPFCLRQKMNPLNLVFGSIWFVSELAEK